MKKAKPNIRFSEGSHPDNNGWLERARPRVAARGVARGARGVGREDGVAVEQRDPSIDPNARLDIVEFVGSCWTRSLRCQRCHPAA